jgi:HEAT repeat protein
VVGQLPHGVCLGEEKSDVEHRAVHVLSLKRLVKRHALTPSGSTLSAKSYRTPVTSPIDGWMRACTLVLCMMIGVPPAAAQPAGPASSNDKFDPAAALKQLKSPDRETRRNALWKIAEHRKEARGLVDALTATLAHPDLPTRYLAAYVLTSVDPAKAGPALPVLKAMLRSDVEMNGSSPRILGPTGLGRLGREGADALVEALADAEPKTQIAAAHGLMDSDVFPPEALPALLQAARGPDADARHQVLMALLWRKPPAERMIQPLLETLTDPVPKMRAAAASGLGGYGRDALRALDALKQATKDTDGYAAITAASAVAVIDRESGLELLPLFIAELTRPERARFTDEYSDIRLSDVSAALAALGPAAGQAVPALSRAFERENWWAKLDLGIALALVDPGSAGPVIKFLIDELEKGDDDTRYRMLMRLPELGKIAAPAAPAVSKLASSSDPMVRDAAAKALAAIKR